MKSHTWCRNFPQWYRAKSVQRKYKLPKCTERSNIQKQRSNVQHLGFLAQGRRNSNVRTFMRHVRTFDASALWPRRAWTPMFERSSATFKRSTPRTLAEFVHSRELGVFPFFIHSSSCTKWESNPTKIHTNPYKSYLLQKGRKSTIPFLNTK